MFDLTGKAILVAGGAGYLGQAMCKGLAGQGGSVMVADLAPDRAEALAAEMAAGGARAAAVQLDVASEPSVQAAVARTVGEFVECVKRWLEVRLASPRLIMAAGDQVPTDAPFRRIAMLPELVAEYGRYGSVDWKPPRE